jgi:hypothetical protein
VNIIKARDLIADALAKCEEFDKILPLGNCVYVHVGNKEYEVVLRTVRPHDSRPLTKIDEDPVL